MKKLVDGVEMLFKEAAVQVSLNRAHYRESLAHSVLMMRQMGMSEEKISFCLDIDSTEF